MERSNGYCYHPYLLSIQEHQQKYGGVVQVVVMNEKVNENETKGIQDTKEDKKKVRFGGDASEKVSENLDVAPSMVKRRATAVDGNIFFFVSKYSFNAF